MLARLVFVVGNDLDSCLLTIHRVFLVGVAVVDFLAVLAVLWLFLDGLDWTAPYQVGQHGSQAISVSAGWLLLCLFPSWCRLFAVSSCSAVRIPIIRTSYQPTGATADRDDALLFCSGLPEYGEPVLLLVSLRLGAIVFSSVDAGPSSNGNTGFK